MALMRRGSLGVNIVTLSTSGGHMTCQDFIMCVMSVFIKEGGGEILNRMSFQGGKSKPLIDKRCCV